GGGAAGQGGGGGGGGDAGGGGWGGGGGGGGAGGPPAYPHVSLARTGCTDSLLEGDRDLRLCVGDRLDRGGGARDRRDARNAGDERRLADQIAVGSRALALRRVEHEIAAPAANEVDHRRPTSPLRHLADILDRP